MIEQTIKIKRQNVFLCFIGVVLSLLIGLRPIGIDSDSLAYFNLYSGIISNSIDSWAVITHTDLGFLLMSKLSIALNLGFRGVLLLYALLAIFLKLIAILKYSMYPYISLYMHITTFMILHEVTQIRAAVSIGFFLLALPYISKKQYVRYILNIIPAIIFHYSACIFLLLIFIGNLKLKSLTYFFVPIFLSIFARLGIFSLSFFNNLLFIFPPFLSNKLYLYINLLNMNGDGVNFYSVAHLSMFFIYYLLLYVRRYFYSDYDHFLLKILFYGLCSFYIFSFLPVLAVRLSGYLSTVLIILLPNAILACKEKKIAVLGLVFVFLLSGIYYFNYLIG